ncbi:GNAT family N-acetyltransferase [Cellulomonas sp. P22]|uniref:GNAT family N-acetyltransferase n=1 Tax=Cellulomonas sp. P22 TaxID=3373189 RepID=UPI003792C096
MIRVERLSEDQWGVLRDVRLRALWQSPHTFGSSLARDQRFKEPHWRMRLRGSPWFVARVDGVEEPLGLVSMLTEPGSPIDDRHVVSLWVDPEHRRRRVASALVGTVIAEARAAGATTVSLWAAEDNVPALGVCEALGFVATGARQTLPRDPSRAELRFELDISAPES